MPPGARNWYGDDFEYDASDGSLLMTGIMPGKYSVNLRLRPAQQGDDPEAGVWPAVRDVEVRAGATTEVELAWSRGRTVTGRVIDAETRQPVSDEQVSLVLREDGASWSTRVLSGPDGRFTFRSPSGSATVIISTYPQGMQEDLRKPVTITAGPAEQAPVDIGDLEHVQRPMARGRLVDPSGKPVAGSVIVGTFRYATATDGSFAVPFDNDGPTTEYLFAFDSTQTLGWAQPVDAPLTDSKLRFAGAELPPIRLKALARISGEVVDASGQAVVDTELTLTIHSERLGIGYYRPPWGGLEWDGKRFTLDGLPAGLHYSIDLRAPGMHGRVDLQDLKPGELRNLEAIVLERMATSQPVPQVQYTGVVRGTVTDDSGKPLPGVRVQAVPVKTAGSVQVDDTTDARGRFIIRGLPQGDSVKLFASADGFDYTRGETDVGASDVALRMMPPGARFLGKPAPELAVRKWISGGPVTLADLRGKVVLLHLGIDMTWDYRGHYWEVFDAAERYAQKGLVVIAVHVDPATARPHAITEQAIVDQIRTRNISFPVAIDRGTMSRYGLREPPALLLIDRQGILRASPRRNEIFGWVEKLLAE